MDALTASITGENTVGLKKYFKEHSALFEATASDKVKGLYQRSNKALGAFAGSLTTRQISAVRAQQSNMFSPLATTGFECGMDIAVAPKLVKLAICLTSMDTIALLKSGTILLGKLPTNAQMIRLHKKINNGVLIDGTMTLTYGNTKLDELSQVFHDAGHINISRIRKGSRVLKECLDKGVIPFDPAVMV